MNAHTFTPRSPARLRRPGGTAVLAGILALAGFLAAPTGVAAAVQDAAAQETAFVLNTFSFLIWGALVMWMCAGFTMLESGSVRSKNASVICLKNIGLYAIAGITYYAVGYGLMYTDVGGGIIGSFDWFYGPSADEVALLGGDASAAAAVVDNGYAVTSDWFFQMVFVATTASIVSGALAERVNLWSFFVFTAILTAFIYPVVGAWTWGGGWLAEMGFTDFAGSTIVHSTGGWAALAGAVVVGPRWGKFRKDGSTKLTPPSNIPAVTLGVFILWLGWFGFNGGSQLALGSAADAVGMSNVLVNTNLAAAAGVITAILVSKPILGRTDLFAGLNGAIGGTGGDHRGTEHHRRQVGHSHRRGRRAALYARAEGTGALENRRCGRSRPRAPLRRHLGYPGGQHRGRGQLRKRSCSGWLVWAPSSSRCRSSSGPCWRRRWASGSPGASRRSARTRPNSGSTPTPSSSSWWTPKTAVTTAIPTEAGRALERFRHHLYRRCEQRSIRCRHRRVGGVRELRSGSPLL